MIIQSDFDGTIITNNLSVLLRENFSQGDWQKIDSDYLQGKMTVEQNSKLQFALIKEPKDKLQDFIRQHIRVRAGFLDLVAYCRGAAMPLVIVSSGLDFYIETVLDEIGASDLEVHCGQASFNKDSIAVSYLDPEGNPIDGGFKQRYLTWLKERGRKVIYIGDGLSDLEAARRADHVFATGHLLRLLGEGSVACSAFADFHDLLRQVRLLDFSG